MSELAYSTAWSKLPLGLITKNVDKRSCGLNFTGYCTVYRKMSETGDFVEMFVIFFLSSNVLSISD